MVAVRAFRQLGFHVGFAAPDHERLDAPVELVEVAIANRPAPVVQFIEVAVEPEERAEDGRVEEVHQRMQFVNAVLDGRAGQHEGITAAEAFDGLCSLRAPVLDTLGFVEHDNVRTQSSIHVECVSKHLFVVDDGEER